MPQNGKTKKPRSNNTIKNRHLKRKKPDPKYPEWKFPDFKDHLKHYCSIEELEAAFEPTKMPRAE